MLTTLSPYSRWARRRPRLAGFAWKLLHSLFGGADDIGPAFQDLKARVDAVYVAVDQLIVANRAQILTLALNERLPTVFSERDFAKAGAFMSYGPNYSDLFRHSADYVDKILRGD
jgi:putative ABC transport system substrate-binding protein